MAAAVTFTNNLGSLSFEYATIGVDDRWTHNGRSRTHVKAISVEARLAAEPFDLQNVLPDIGPLGEPGSLILPWTTLSGIKLISLASGDGTWIDSVPVRAEFIDDHPDDQFYTMHFFGLELHAPRLEFSPAARRWGDQFVQMPWVSGGWLDTDELRNGPIRSVRTEEMLTIRLAGTIRLEDYRLPADLVDHLAQRHGTAATLGQTNPLPAGYPRVFRLEEAIPELVGGLEAASVFVAESSASWDVGDGMVNVQINMLCPPQRIEQGTGV